MTTSSPGESDAHTGRGARAAEVAAFIGLIPAIILGALSFFPLQEPQVSEQLAGNLVLSLTWAAPYVLVLMASQIKRPGARGALLAVFGLLSLAASFSVLVSPITLIFLPATFAIWFAAARSLTAAVRPFATTTFAAIAGILIVAMVGLSFYALLWLGEPEPKCWELSPSADGRYVWEALPDVAGQSEAQGVTLTRSGTCVSDLITNAEAGVSAGLLVIALVVMIVTMRLPWIRSPNKPAGTGGITAVGREAASN